VLRPGGVLTISDIATQRWPRDPVEYILLRAVRP